MRSIKVMMHAHSNWSYDGRWSLDAIARLFGRLGYDCVMMSEHDTGFDPQKFPDYRAACQAASTPRCALIPGIEYSSPDNDIHILTWGLDHFLTEHQPVIDTLRAVHEQKGGAIFAHPKRRNAFAKYDPAWTPYLSGVEVWNRKTDGLTFGVEAIQLISNTGLMATVGSDFHILRHLYPLSTRFNIDEDQPIEAALVTALRQGAHTAHAFGRPITDQSGQLKRGAHTQLESMRRAALRIFRK
ncbi:MAG: PHP domain-containing protein [Hyphomicrobiaceae bacterium]